MSLGSWIVVYLVSVTCDVVGEARRYSGDTNSTDREGLRSLQGHRCQNTRLHRRMRSVVQFVDFRDTHDVLDPGQVVIDKGDRFALNVALEEIRVRLVALDFDCDNGGGGFRETEATERVGDLADEDCQVMLRWRWNEREPGDGLTLLFGDNEKTISEWTLRLFIRSLWESTTARKQAANT